VVKELAKYLPPEDFKRFLPLTKSSVFIDREPHLQYYSLLRLRAEADKGGKLKPDEVLASDNSIAEKAVGYDSSSREAMQQHIALMNEYKTTHPDYKTAFASGLALLADRRNVLEKMAERAGLLDGIPDDERAQALDSLEKDWTKSTGANFHGLYPGASIGNDGATDSAWIGQAVRSSGFQTLGKKEDTPFPLEKFPEAIQHQMLQHGIPNYMNALLQPDNITHLTAEQLNTLRFSDKLLEDINPIEAYALAATSPDRTGMPEIMARVQSKYPEHKTAFQAVDDYIAKHEKKLRAGFHYSGVDHRPYDYSTKHPGELEPAFSQSRFGKSLTNINPRHYKAEEKERLYTLDFATKALAAGDISAPKDHTVLWSGGYIPGHPLGYGLGRITAERWLVEKNKPVEAAGKEYHEIKDQLYHTVAMTEAGLPVLNPMWDDLSVSMETKQAVTPTYIIGFAKTARGEVTLNVDDTDIDSFFRQNEIDVVMKNPHITQMRVVRIDPATDNLVETLYPDRQSWYEAQKDQWVDSIVTRYNQATAARDGGTIGEKLFQRMSGALVEEMLDSYRNMTAGNPLLTHNDEVARQASAAREMERLKKFAPLVEAQPELLDHDKIPSEPARVALKQFFDKLLKGSAAVSVRDR
jgi:hypothetical protein